MEEWQEELNTPYLNVSEEGVYTVEVYGAPEKVTNNFGKEQWMFEPACVAGLKGKLTPPKGLLRLLSQALEDQEGSYPIKIRVERIGTSLDTKFIMQKYLEE